MWYMPVVESLDFPVKPGAWLPAVFMGMPGLLWPGYAKNYHRKTFSADIKDSGGKNFARMKKIIGSVPAMPGNHPAYHREIFMERLGRGEKTAIKELVNISPGKIFHCITLLECIEQNAAGLSMGGPGFYDLLNMCKKKKLRENWEKLKNPVLASGRNWLMPSPPEHYFFPGKRRPINREKYHGTQVDLYLWRPQRFTLYRGKTLKIQWL